MKILVLGNGAREHAICKSLAKSRKKPEIVCFGSVNNPGIAEIATKIEIGSLVDFEHIIRFVKAEKPDFAVLGPEDPIAAGIADELKKNGIESIGPTKKLARIESSKSFTRKLLQKYNISGNPKFKIFFADDGMEEFAKECGNIVVKFDGLAGGKGVQVQGDHFSGTEEGLEIARKYLKASGKVVIEEKLIGQEFSFLFFSDGTTLTPMPLVQDNKRAFVGDKGPNTGGMGSISDTPHSLPFLKPSDVEQAKKMAADVMSALQAECDGEKFKGILFGGFMAVKDGVRLIEFNARFGDPEALNVLPLLSTDFVDICEAIIHEKLGEINIEFLKLASVCKYVVPQGYPENPIKDELITIDESKIPEDVETFFAGVEKRKDGLYMKGSRAVAFTALADTLAEAQYLAETAAKSVSGHVFHREDIGTTKLLSDRIVGMRILREK